MYFVLCSSLSFVWDHLCVTWDGLSLSVCVGNPTRCLCDTLSERIWQDMTKRACQGVRTQVFCLTADPRLILNRMMLGFDKCQCSKPNALQVTEVSVTFLSNALLSWALWLLLLWYYSRINRCEVHFFENLAFCLFWKILSYETTALGYYTQQYYNSLL